jgi:type I restriction enzyme, S subunit
MASKRTVAMSEQSIVSRHGRFKPYDAYKDSGVEWLRKIPANWRSERIKYIATLNPPKSEIRDTNGRTLVSFVPMEAVDEDGRLDMSRTMPIETGLQQGYTYFKNNDVLVAKITPCFENGKGALALGLENSIGFGTTEFHVLRSKQESDPRFLFYVTVSDHFRRLGTAAMYGAAGQKRISEQFVVTFSHPFPDIEEQRAIAAFLDREIEKINALIAKKERLIELLQEQRASLISNTVTHGLNLNVAATETGIEWVGAIPDHWNLWHLRRVVDRFVDYRGQTPEKTIGGTRLVTARNVKQNRIDFSQSEEFISESDYATWMSRGLPESGDVLITTEAPLGEVAQIDDPDVALAQRLILLKANKSKICNEYLKYHFASDSGRSELYSRATGSTAVGIKASHLKETLITVPPLLEQRAIARHIELELSCVDKLEKRVRDGIIALRTLRETLVARAVTGQIDVRAEMT